MTTPHYDLILVGGGLANGLIALRLKLERPALRLLMLERDARPGGNHTWSFHAGDLDAAQHAWLSPLVGCRWAGHRVVFPQRTRQLRGGYASIFSADFAGALEDALGNDLWADTCVESVQPTHVTLADGRVLHAGAVIDGRGVTNNPHVALGHQAFLGQEVRLALPHGLEQPILMDASVTQDDGYRFVYVLPFTADTLLIEDTHYVDGPQVDAASLRGHIQAYAQAQGWEIRETLREEHGVLPITLAGDIEAFWRDADGQPRSGLRAGLFHPTTGYSLPHAVRLAELIAGLDDLSAPALFAAIRDTACREWRHQGYFRLLNRMLFLAGRSDQRWRVMQRFYGLPEPLIERFYAGRLTSADKLRIVVGKPPVPLGEAARAVQLTRPEQVVFHQHRSRP
ncbi:lycopene beta-cyclase CrtY [Halomonas sp. McH1-25]|uniref:lycopene beta-cyclase CrtY n=2 Tax=Halomonas TaxID=2745 RepID=UPI001EF69BDB|nr:MULTISPECIES: lycopene beta-cyclase CrtY [unclassified Halomonas]MCG7599296.1 lycopene beta-cyclase CrtY [Halomonas sp. McH1-25]MCP1341164.1 lycopene beta-cyclase CrtY [Halomonas sp. FL8]